MQAQNTKMSLDFTGKNIYVGIDTHHKSWMVRIYSDEFEFRNYGATFQNYFDLLFCCRGNVHSGYW